ncbi:hypothetical protein OG982_30645 [Streptomyces sp. NBC_01551]|uniref:hypothetical protein n=1 Tax=Streptomyces sp. NBC_01551 TaxID=2975876 RepID=UPI00224CA475|nr:hypothetical protein [Streptomyces sp. NBC_01551]MCX4529981.1 hypothetical protein [Streptomyces sp. NBC_01551]
MKTSTMPWFESLTDSVYALGAAAREAQHAHQGAVLNLAQSDLDRLRLVEGGIQLPHWSVDMPYQPHVHTIALINGHHRNHADMLYLLHHQSAQAYAYGTTWAIRQVLAGNQPPLVELTRTPQGFYTVPGEAYPSTEAFEGLKGWSGRPDFDRALAEMERREAAAEYASGPDTYDEPFGDDGEYIADHEASAMHDASIVAEGLPDAMYAYGQQAERALRFALLEPRRQNSRS